VAAVDVWELPQLSDAWSRMQASLLDSICVVRDSAYLRYRYFEHPTNRYQVYRVSSSSSGRLIGAFVLRQENSDCELLDLVAALEDMPLLVHEARHIAAQLGSASLYCWVAASFATAIGKDAESKDLGVYVPTNVWVPGPSPDRLQGKWWLMSGDTEFR
jgi:hypothetical protein